MALTPVEATLAFRRAYKAKPEPMRKAIREAVTQLRRDHTHNGLRTHRIQGAKGVYEARLNGGNRLTFHWRDDTIVLRKHCNHDILKRP